MSGRADSTVEIGKREGVNKRYVGRVIRLAFLTTEIVEQIVNGCQPVEFTAQSLLNDRTELPLAWDAQHEVLGFPTPLDPPDAAKDCSGPLMRRDRALMVGKAVRMTSGIRAALVLGDLGYIAECGTLLRTVSDFMNEIVSVYEGYKQGAPTEAQKRFVRQYFARIATDPEYENQKRERWVTRDELFAAHIRWATETGGDPERLRRNLRYLAHMYDKFVHGAYITATERYDPLNRTFMLRGHQAPIKRDEYKRAVASKLHQVLTALGLMADESNMPVLFQEIGTFMQDLYKSGESQGNEPNSDRQIVLAFRYRQIWSNSANIGVVGLAGRAAEGLLFGRHARILVQESDESLEELHVGGIASYKDVIFAFEGQQPGTGNKRCELAPLFERHDQIAAAMYDESRYRNLGRQRRDIDSEARRHEIGSIL